MESTTVLPLKGNCLTLYRKSNFSGNKDKQDVDIPMKIKNTLQKTGAVFRNYGHNSLNFYWFKFSLIFTKLFNLDNYYQDFLIPQIETFPKEIISGKYKTGELKKGS